MEAPRAVLTWALVALLATSAHAAVLFSHAADDVTCTSQGTGCGIFSAPRTDSGGLVCFSQTATSGNRIHIGDGTSQRAFRVVPATTETCWWAETFVATDTVTVGARLHVQSIDATKDVIEIREVGDVLACNAQVTSGRAPALRYGTTPLGDPASDFPLHARICANGLTLCDEDSDCPSAVCQVCSDGNPQGCAQAALELRAQRVVAQGVTRCALLLFGRPILEGEVGAGGQFTSARWGVLGGDSGAASYFLDSIIGTNTDRAGIGYVGVLGITGDDATLQWSRNGCGGSGHFECPDGWTSALLHDTAFLSVNSAGKVEQLTLTDPPNVLPGDVPRIVLKGAGRANNSTGTRTFEARFYLCDPAGCASGRQFEPGVWQSIYSGTADQLIVRHPLFEAPDGSAWTSELLARLAIEFENVSGSGQQVVNLLVEYAAIAADPKTPAFLRHHNPGVNDDEVTCYWAGHSNTSGVGGNLCHAPWNPTFHQTSCVQATAASWDPDGDSPSGGCATDAEVQTCTGRRPEFNGGAGIPCTDNDQCPQTGATCDGDPSGGDGIKEGTCSQSLAEPLSCDVPADCNGFGGTCDTDATCISTCGPDGPTGEKPSCLGPSGYARLASDRVSCDNHVICAQGAEGLAEFRANRLDALLAGDHSTCVIDTGAGYCGCAGDGECPGGTCGGDGRCVDSDRCTAAGDCVSGMCLPPLPDRVFLHQIGVANTIMGGGAANDDCSLASHVSWAGSSSDFSAAYCLDDDRCVVDDSSDLCWTDAEAQAAARTGPDGSPSARCVGANRSNAQEACLDGLTFTPFAGLTAFGEFNGNCTAITAPCFTGADCGANQTCDGGDDADSLPRGYCVPDDDTGCPDGFRHRGSLCRMNCGRCSNNANRRCGLDADCLAGGTCGANPGGSGAHADCRAAAASDTINVCAGDAPFVCAGRATCPSDRTLCAEDADCNEYDITIKGISGRITEVCNEVTGRCDGGGLAYECGGADVHPNAVRNWRQRLHRGGRSLLDEIDAIQATFDALAAGDADGGPVLTWVVEPGGAGGGCLAFNDYQMTAGVGRFMLEHPEQYPSVIDGRSALVAKDLRYMLSGDASVVDPLRCVEGDRQFGRAVAPCIHYSSDAFLPEEQSGQHTMASTVAHYAQAQGACAIGTCRRPGRFYGAACGEDGDCGAGETCSFEGLPRPQFYCVESDGAYTDVTCDTAADCTGAQSCGPRACTCACTQDDECLAWYGAGNACVAGECIAGGAVSSCTIAGTFDVTRTCEAGMCRNTDDSDTCPAALDGCNPE